MMTALDIWAAIAAAIASVATGVRAEMLKPDAKSFFTAPPWIFLALTLLSLAFAIAAISVAGATHATAREATVYSVSALVAVLMLVNLYRQRVGQA